MNINWSWIIFGFLVLLIVAGIFLLVFGLEKPHENNPDNTVNYNTLKWAGIYLLSIGGAGMLIWVIVYFVNRPDKGKIVPLKESLLSSGSTKSNNERLDYAIDSARSLNKLRESAKTNPKLIPLVKNIEKDRLLAPIPI